MEQLINNVIQWAEDKNLLKKENSFQQFTKVVEETGEIASALAKNQPENLIDAIGDTWVTLIILAAQNGLRPEQCLEAAWNEIKDRKGKTENGVFIKEVNNQ
jgi:NTP pyrophosphatase (non-canonical NTP hydrolase)